MERRIGSTAGDEVGRTLTYGVRFDLHIAIVPPLADMY